MAIRPVAFLSPDLALHVPGGTTVLNVQGATALGLELIQAAAARSVLSVQKQQAAQRRSVEQATRRRRGQG